MKVKKSFCFISVLCFQVNFADFYDYECKEQYNENETINEFIEKFLNSSSEIDHNLCLCGNISVNSLVINQKDPLNRENERLFFSGNLNLKYLGSTNEIGYGFEINSKINSGVAKKGQPIFNKLLIFLEFDKFGKINFGYDNSAASKFKIDGSDVLVGYKSFGNNNFSSFFNKSAGAIIGTKSLADDENAAKISWISPLYKGFSLGLSYSVSGKNISLLKSERKKRKKYASDSSCDLFSESSYSKNLLSAGMTYEYGSLDDIFAKFSLSGLIGKGKSEKSDIKVKNTKAFHVGAMFGYDKFKTSFGFTNNGKSLIPSLNNENHVQKHAGKIYSLGLSYAISKKLEISTGGLYSKVKFREKGKSETQIFTVAFEYLLKENLKTYTEYNRIKTTGCNQAITLAENNGTASSFEKKNKANMLMIGLKYEF